MKELHFKNHIIQKNTTFYRVADEERKEWKEFKTLEDAVNYIFLKESSDGLGTMED